MSAQPNSDTEGRDQQILRRLSNIEHKVDSLDQTTAFALRADAKRHMEVVQRIFRGKRRAQVYLAANARRGVEDIAELIHMKANNVSRELSALADEGFLEVIEKDGGKVYWGKKPIDRNLQISRFLMREYRLDSNGLPPKKKS